METKDKFFKPVIVFLVIAFIGFSDAAYLVVQHYSGQLPVCSEVNGCDVVAMSDYATIVGIPVALFGAIFYALMLVLGVAWLDTKKPVVLKLLLLFTIPAFLFTVWLIYHMFFSIEAICIYCLLSASTTTLILILSLWFYSKLR